MKTDSILSSSIKELEHELLLERIKNAEEQPDDYKIQLQVINGKLEVIEFIKNVCESRGRY